MSNTGGETRGRYRKERNQYPCRNLFLVLIEPSINRPLRAIGAKPIFLSQFSDVHLLKVPYYSYWASSINTSNTICLCPLYQPIPSFDVITGNNDNKIYKIGCSGFVHAVVISDALINEA